MDVYFLLLQLIDVVHLSQFLDISVYKLATASTISSHVTIESSINRMHMLLFLSEYAQHTRYFFEYVHSHGHLLLFHF